MASLAIPLLIAGGTVATVGTIQQGRAAEKQGKFQEEIAQRNAALTLKQAEGERQAAAEQALQLERQGKALKGKQRAVIAKAGVGLRGSPLSILVETAQDIEADRLTILREGAIRSSSLENQSKIIQAQGAAAKSRGRAAKRSSVLSGIGTGLTTIGTAGALGSGLIGPDTTIPSRASFGLT